MKSTLDLRGLEPTELFVSMRHKMIDDINVTIQQINHEMEELEKARQRLENAKYAIQDEITEMNNRL